MSQVKEYFYTDCGCNAGFRPGVVLDPFCGSGTVMKVAEQLNRKAIGLDLGYQTLSVKRLQNVQKELTL
jgi:DNA modification methylase